MWTQGVSNVPGPALNQVPGREVPDPATQGPDPPANPRTPASGFVGLRAGRGTSPVQRVVPCGPGGNAGREVRRSAGEVPDLVVGVRTAVDARFPGSCAVPVPCARSGEPHGWSSRPRGPGSPACARGVEPCGRGARPCDRSRRPCAWPRGPRGRRVAARDRPSACGLRCRRGRGRRSVLPRRPSEADGLRSDPGSRRSPTRRWGFSYNEPGISPSASVRMKPSPLASWPRPAAARHRATSRRGPPPFSYPRNKSFLTRQRASARWWRAGGRRTVCAPAISPAPLTRKP